MHNERYVDSRSILKETLDFVKAEVMALLKNNKVKGMEHVNVDDIADLVFHNRYRIGILGKNTIQSS